MNDRNPNLECFKEFKKQANEIKNERDLKNLEIKFRKFSYCFGNYKSVIDAFFDSKYKEFKKNKLNNLIRPFDGWDSLNYNIKGEEALNKKIGSIKDPKIKYAFEGMFNLLTEKNNLVYNPLYTRQKIINDLNLFKSLNFFKVVYVSPSDLKGEYAFLSVKKGATKFYSKLYFVKHGLYVMKTLNHDGITLKVFYIKNNIKDLLREAKIKNKLPKDDKFNLSSVDAWKTLDKADNIRFYAYCNANGLNKTNRVLLRSIRQMEGGESFSCHLEKVEDSLSILEAEYVSNPTIELDNGSVIPNYELQDELWEVRHQYWYLTEEHNSDNIITTIEDY